MAKVTLSVPDEIYARIETHKDQLNLSEIFRVCVSEEIEKLEGKAQIITELKDYLLTKFPFAAERKTEIDRFTRKWGTPEVIEPDDLTQPYVKLMKNQPIALGNTTLASKIFTHNMSPLGVCPSIRVDFDLEKWNDVGQGKLGHIVDFFKFNGFSVGEYYSGNADGFNWGLAPVMLKELLTDDEMKATEGIMREFVVLGLFALDKDDVVFIAYRKEINKMSPLRQNEMSKEGIE